MSDEPNEEPRELDPQVVEALNQIDRQDIEAYLAQEDPWHKTGTQYAGLDEAQRRNLYPYACALYLLHCTLAHRLAEHVDPDITIHEVNEWGALLSSLVSYRVVHEALSQAEVSNLGQTTLMAVAGAVQTQPPSPGDKH